MLQRARIAPGPRPMCPAGLTVSATWRFAQKRSYEDRCSKKNEKITITIITINIYIYNIYIYIYIYIYFSSGRTSSSPFRGGCGGCICWFAFTYHDSCRPIGGGTNETTCLVHTQVVSGKAQFMGGRTTIRSDTSSGFQKATAQPRYTLLLYIIISSRSSSSSTTAVQQHQRLTLRAL